MSAPSNVFATLNEDLRVVNSNAMLGNDCDFLRIPPIDIRPNSAPAVIPSMPSSTLSPQLPPFCPFRRSVAQVPCARHALVGPAVQRRARRHLHRSVHVARADRCLGAAVDAHAGVARLQLSRVEHRRRPAAQLAGVHRPGAGAPQRAGSQRAKLVAEALSAVRRGRPRAAAAAATGMRGLHPHRPFCVLCTHLSLHLTGTQAEPAQKILPSSIVERERPAIQPGNKHEDLAVLPLHSFFLVTRLFIPLLLLLLPHFPPPPRTAEAPGAAATTCPPAEIPAGTGVGHP